MSGKIPSLANDSSGGEVEIEKLPMSDVEIRKRDLLPVLDCFHRVQSDWSDRQVSGVSYYISSFNSDEAKQEPSEDSLANHSDYSFDSIEHSDTESSVNSHPPAISTKIKNGASSDSASTLRNQSSLNKVRVSVSYTEEGCCDLESEHCETELGPDQDSNSGACDEDKLDEDVVSDYMLG